LEINKTLKIIGLANNDLANEGTKIFSERIVQKLFFKKVITLN